MIHELDIVKLKKNIKKNELSNECIIQFDRDLLKGEEGTVIETFGDPLKAIQVEFSNNQGISYAILILNPEDVEVITEYKPQK